MDEYITTLMMNMIADFFTYWAITYPFFEKNANPSNAANYKKRLDA
jgi:simple sugar transport system permease protein